MASDAYCKRLQARTIRENIAYGRLNATETEIVEAARFAQLNGVIAALPAGLDTMIGARGANYPPVRKSVSPSRASS